MKEKRNKTSIEYRVQECSICKLVRLCQRHHFLDFGKYGECHEGLTLPLCGSCHETLHIAIGAIIFKRKRASEVWNALILALGKDNIYIRSIEEKVYITAEIRTEWEIKYYEI
jgi:hypothetical protein